MIIIKMKSLVRDVYKLTPPTIASILTGGGSSCVAPPRTGILSRSGDLLFDPVDLADMPLLMPAQQFEYLLNGHDAEAVVIH